LANVRTIELYNGLIPMPESFGEPVYGVRGAQLNELLELRAQKKMTLNEKIRTEKNMSLITPSVTPPIEVLSDAEMNELIALRKEKKLCLPGVSSTNIFHQLSSIYLIPASTKLIDSSSGLGTRSLAHNDSVAYIHAGRCLIQPSSTSTVTSSSQAPGEVLDSGAQRGATGRKSEIFKRTGTSLLMQPAVGPTKHMTGILMGAETRDCHGKPFVLVVLDISVYDPAMSDSLFPVGRLIEAGFAIIHRIPSQAKEDGFSLKTVPLYGGTITTPAGRTTIVMEYAQHT